MIYVKKLKVIQVGVGHDHAMYIFDSIISQTDVFEVVGFAVPDCEKVRFESQIIHCINNNIPEYTVEEALDLPGLDGAIIETEEKNLTKYAYMAAKKGLHIHMDKPSGIEHKEFCELIQELKDRNLAFTTGYMYRFNPYIIEAMKLINSGKIGDVYCVEAHMDCEHVKSKREWLSQFPGGMMFFLGCHLVDLVYAILGMPKEVIPFNCATGNEGVKAEDYGMTLFRYDNGVSFIKTCASEIGGFTRRQLVICGTKGTIELRPLECCSSTPDGRKDMFTTIRVVTNSKGDWNYDGIKKDSELFNRYDAMMLNFAQIANGEKENPYSYDYELELNKLVLMACGK